MTATARSFRTSLASPCWPTACISHEWTQSHWMNTYSQRPPIKLMHSGASLAPTICIVNLRCCSQLKHFLGKLWTNSQFMVFLGFRLVNHISDPILGSSFSWVIEQTWSISRSRTPRWGGEGILERLRASSGFPVPVDLVWPGPGSGSVKRRQLIKGSWTKASIMAITLSLLVLNTCMTFSHVDRKFPSIPLTSIAFTSIRVSLNGTYMIRTQKWESHTIQIISSISDIVRQIMSLCILLHVFIQTALPSQETFLDSWRPQNNPQSQYEESSHCMSQLEVQNTKLVILVSMSVINSCFGNSLE